MWRIETANLLFLGNKVFRQLLWRTHELTHNDAGKDVSVAEEMAGVSH